MSISLETPSAQSRPPHEAQGLAEAVRRELDERPLGPTERWRGSAVRVLACWRTEYADVAPQGPLVWSVVVLARDPQNLVAPHTCGPAKVWSGDAVGEPLGRATVCLGALGTWEAAEYGLLLPASAKLFSLRAGYASYTIAWTRKVAMVNSCIETVANASTQPGYPEWLAAREARLAELPVPADGPLMSIVMPVYQTPPAFLQEAIGSVLGQTYGRWELVRVNASPDDAGVAEVLSRVRDERVKVVEAAQNLGIAGNTNLGLEHVTGGFVLFFDHDDVLSPHALATYVRALDERGLAPDDLVLLYCDEDNIDEQGNHCLPLLKPGLNKDLLLSCNYAIHWLGVSRATLEATERSPQDVNGAQDYDLTLKAIAAGSEVMHVSELLYHWRIHSGSVASGSASKPYAMLAGQRAIEGYLAQEGVGGIVAQAHTDFTYEVSYPVPDAPSILVVSSGRVSGATAAALDVVAHEVGARVGHAQAERPSGRRLAALAEEAAAPLMLLLAPEVDLDASVLLQMLGHLARPEVFGVSPRVARPDGLLDYANQVVRPDGSLMRMNHLLPADDNGYVVRIQRAYDASTLNAECALVRTDALASLVHGGYQSLEFALADACLQARRQGLLSVYLGSCEARLNAGRSLVAPPALSHAQDQALLLRRNASLLEGGDPSHNPNFDPWSPYYALREG